MDDAALLWLLGQLERLYRGEASELSALVKSLRDSLRAALTNEFELSAPDGKWSADDAQFNARMARLQDALTYSLVATLDQVRAQMLLHEIAAYRMGYYGTAWQMDDPAAPVQMPMLADKAIAEQMQLPYVDATLNQRLYDVRTDLETRMRREWTMSQTEAETLTQAQRRTTNLLGVGAAMAGTSLLYRVLTIGESEFYRAANTGADTLAGENPKILLGKAWFTREDERVCKRCGKLHGTVVPPDEKFFDAIGNVSVNAPPLHTLCRCFLRATRTPVSANVNPLDYYDWAKSNQIEMAMDGRNLL